MCFDFYFLTSRLWLIDCPVISASVEVAMRLYKEASAVPYMGKFIVFAKRPEVDEALMRCFCITDDKVDKVNFHLSLLPFYITQNLRS